MSVLEGRLVGEAHKPKYLRYAKSINIGNNRSTAVRCYKDNVLVKEILIYPDKDKFCVDEMELTENKRTGEKYMVRVYFNVHAKFSYARSEFIGRVCSAAYEHANSSDDFELGNGIFK